ncbi:hypothetical protein Tco_1164770 [Tanacetum coccineum]
MKEMVRVGVVCRPIKPAPPKPATPENFDDSEDDDFNPDAPEDLGAVANNNPLLELPSDDSEDDDFNPDKVDSDDDSGPITAKRHVERLDYKKLYDTKVYHDLSIFVTCKDSIMAWIEVEKLSLITCHSIKALKKLMAPLLGGGGMLAQLVGGLRKIKKIGLPRIVVSYMVECARDIGTDSFRLVRLGLLVTPAALKTWEDLRSYFTRYWEGDVTVVMPATLVQYLKIIQNPSHSELQKAANQGQRCTWEKLSAIKANCGIELALDECVTILNHMRRLKLSAERAAAASHGTPHVTRFNASKRIPSWNCIA